MNEPDDYEYNGRQSRYPPVLMLLGYFGFGIGSIILSFDQLNAYRQLENPSAVRGLQPMMRVNWLEKLLYELGGKYLVFGLGITFGILLIGYGVLRFRGWLRLRNSRNQHDRRP